MEPYRYASGETWGDETPPLTAPSWSPPRRPAKDLGRRARRAKTDPDWTRRSEASKRLLLEVDRRDERGQR
jgi:hypothetical protein